MALFLFQTYFNFTIIFRVDAGDLKIKNKEISTKQQDVLKQISNILKIALAEEEVSIILLFLFKTKFFKISYKKNINSKKKCLNSQDVLKRLSNEKISSFLICWIAINFVTFLIKS